MQTVTLAHGNGGRHMRKLIDELIAPLLGDLLIDTQADATTLDPIADNMLPVITTDGFTVKPLVFPGGDIGSLAIHGTVNDLAVAGATPHYLSLAMIIEEGLPFSTLKRIISSLAKAARQCQIRIATGDTKVVPQGEAGGLYLTTTGLGTRPSTLKLSPQNICEGDVILVSGPIGDHGSAVMLARENFGLQGDILSDSACILPLTQALLGLQGLRFMRDPTRGGLATVLHEIQNQSGLGIQIEETKIPIREAVVGVCDILGFDPLYLACEGRVVAVVSEDQADEALRRWRAQDAGQAASIIGGFVSSPHHVVLKTPIGGERLLFELEDDPLPRIC